MNKVSGLQLNHRSGRDLQLRQQFYTDLAHLSPSQAEALLDLIKRNYMEVVELKEKNLEAVNLKRIFDIVLVRSLPADEYFKMASSAGTDPVQILKSWITKNQEAVGLESQGIDAESIITSLRKIQREIRRKSERDYDAKFWTVVVYGSSINGRSVKNKSDYDVRTDTKEALQFMQSVPIEKAIEALGFTNVSSTFQPKLNLQDINRLSPVVIFIKADVVKIVVYKTDPLTGQTTNDPFIELELQL